MPHLHLGRGFQVNLDRYRESRSGLVPEDVDLGVRAAAVDDDGEFGRAREGKIG